MTKQEGWNQLRAAYGDAILDWQANDEASYGDVVAAENALQNYQDSCMSDEECKQYSSDYVEKLDG